MGAYDHSLGVIPIQRLTTLVNGAVDDRLECTDTGLGSGAGSTSAKFEIPELLFDSERESLRGALVQVYRLRLDGSMPDNPDFQGYLCTDTAEASESDDKVSFEAYTATKFLDATHVGQQLHRSTIRFLLVDPLTGKKTGMTPLKALQDIFGAGGSSSISGGLGSYWRSRIRLGLTTVLNDTSLIETPEIVFRNANYHQALDQILALYGDVAFRERFEGGMCYLDFYRIQDPSAAKVQCTVCDFDDPAEVAGNVGRIKLTTSVEQTKDRVIVYSKPRRMVVSVLSYVAAVAGLGIGEATSAKRLVKDWDTRYEAAVLADPKSAKPGSLGYSIKMKSAATSGDTVLSIESAIAVWTGAILITESAERMLVTGYTAAVGPTPATVTVTRGYQGTTAAAIGNGRVVKWWMPGIEWVFRRYRLPNCFLAYVKLKENALTRANGQAYPVQAFKYPTVCGADPEGDADKIGTVSIVPEHIRNGVTAEFDRNRIILREPAINVTKIETDPELGGLKITRQEAVIGVTFTFESLDDLHYDTGQNPASPAKMDFAHDGLTEMVPRDDFLYAQLTNVDYPLMDADGNNLLFGAVVFDEDDDYNYQTYVTKTVIRDDTAKARQLARQILREKSRPHLAYEIEFPYHTRAYEIGQLVEPIGQADYVPGEYMITQISHNFAGGDHSTTITCDNVKPPRRRTLRGK